MKKILNKKEIPAMLQKNKNPVMLKKLPEFKTSAEEFEFWAKHDATEFVNMAKSERIDLPDLKPTLKKISMNLPLYLMEQLKIIAHKKGIPYQSLMKIMLSKEIKQELDLFKQG